VPCTPPLGEVAAAVETLGDYRKGTTGTLRLNVPGVVARVILPPIAARFLAAHPGITLEVTADDSFIDVLAAGFDAGVRYDSRLEQDMIAVPLGPRTQQFVTSASPAYLKARGTPRHPRDLLKHACVRHRFPSRVTAPWEFERGMKTLKIAVRGPLVATNMEMEVEAAVQGLGLVHTFEEFVQPMRTKGRLERVLGEWSPRFPGPCLYYPGGRHVPPPLRAFVDFLHREERVNRRAPRN
jgi:DNA-binding transcriptional LysR family regulator